VTDVRSERIFMGFPNNFKFSAPSNGADNPILKNDSNCGHSSIDRLMR